MGSTKKTITYFDKRGPQNTDETLELSLERAQELGISDVLVASTRGYTGIKAAEVFKDLNLVVVSHSMGYKENGVREMSRENQKSIEEKGAKVLTGTHVFAGVERAIKDHFSTVYPTEIIAETLLVFSDGVKVGVEITAMATDAGLISSSRDIISIGGSNQGADTALVIKPANSKRLFEMKIKEIIAIPSARK